MDEVSPARRLGARGTNPLNPHYLLPGWSQLAQQPSPPRPEPRSFPVSRSLNSLDIPGAQPAPNKALRPSSRLYGRSFDYSDVPFTRPLPLGTISGTLHYSPTPRPTSTSTSMGIEGSSPQRFSHRFVRTPGSGTLNAGDIPGSMPRGGSRACTRMHRTPNIYFNLKPRSTLLSKPATDAYFERTSRHS